MEMMLFANFRVARPQLTFLSFLARKRVALLKIVFVRYLNWVITLLFSRSLKKREDSDAVREHACKPSR